MFFLATRRLAGNADGAGRLSIVLYDDTGTLLDVGSSEDIVDWLMGACMLASFFFILVATNSISTTISTEPTVINRKPITYTGGDERRTLMEERSQQTTD